jgi:signal transduction histidine kinase
MMMYLFCCRNLISIAIKFSPSATTIELGSKSNETQVLFYTRDKGPGISKSDQKYLFKKFHS